MAEGYELKQVKVRLKLAEAEPLYSTEQITTPDKAAEVMAQALAQMDREYCCVVNLDGANHPINFNVVSIGDVNQAHVPIQNVFKSAILSNAASIMMFHNHPSGSTHASKEDIEVTKKLIEAGRIMNIPVLDHIIVAGGSAEHFSFRDNNPEMFDVKEQGVYMVREPRTDIEGDKFSIYQLKDDDSLRYIRFEGLKRLQKEGGKVERDNYNLVYEAELKPGTTLDDLYHQFNMQHPADFRGHSMSVSDIVVLHQGEEDKAFYVDSFGFTELPEFLLEKVADLELDEAAYKLGDRYISIQHTDVGFDYSIYDEGFHLLDGGVLDDPDISIGEVLQQIIEELKQPVYDAERDTYTHTALQGNVRQKDVAEAVDYDDLMEKVDAVGQEEIQAVKSEQEIIAEFRAKTEQCFDSSKLEGLRPAEIEESVRAQVREFIKDYNLDVHIDDVIVTGSRARGLEKPDSDIDVVVTYTGSEPEDSLFNTLHEEKIFLGNDGVELDINPINTDKSGGLAEYLTHAEQYLADKAAQIEQSKIIAFPEKPKQVVTFTVAESSEFHSFGELHEGIPRLEDALKVYEELCEKSNLSGIPAVGINVHTVGTPAYEDMQSDFLSGKRLDLDNLMYLPEMSQNEEVIEALHGMKEAYPDVEVIGRFPDEMQEQVTFGPSVQKQEEALAVQIDEIQRDFDLYDYNDAVDDREENIRQLQTDIESGNTGYIYDGLHDIIEGGGDSPEYAEKAKELIKKLDEYKPLAKVEEREEQNYNMIDNVLNNLPQDPEEKKEPAPQKEMRIAEQKKVHKRVSMKKLLAEKKAEVAEREKKPPEVGAPSKRPSMGMDD